MNEINPERPVPVILYGGDDNDMNKFKIGGVF